MKARIYVTLKNGVLDPQGKAIEGALGHLGFNNVDSVRQGKLVEVVVNESDKAKAEASVDEMCKKLLVNQVIEDYSFELSE